MKLNLCTNRIAIYLIHRAQAGTNLPNTIGKSHESVRNVIGIHCLASCMRWLVGGVAG